jgi:hypothetical protein
MSIEKRLHLSVWHLYIYIPIHMPMYVRYLGAEFRPVGASAAGYGRSGCTDSRRGVVTGGRR